MMAITQFFPLLWFKIRLVCLPKDVLSRLSGITAVFAQELRLLLLAPGFEAILPYYSETLIILRATL